MTQTPISPVGKYLRKLRVDTDENGKAMADRIGVSRSHLSFIEQGKRTLQDNQIKQLIESYSLSAEEVQEFKRAIDMSLTRIKIDLGGKSDNARKVAFLFSRNLEKLSEADCQEITRILNKENQ